VIAFLAVVALVTAGLSLLAWYRLSRRPREEPDARLDSDDPNV
jgi:hypothetical protein